MIPEKCCKGCTCCFCKGTKTLDPGTTEFIARVHDRVIVIRDVPAFICRQCGEAYYSAETSRRIDIVMDRVQRGTIGEYSHPLAACEVTLPTLPTLL